MKARTQGRSLSATRRLTLMAVFAAMAYAVMSVFRIKVQFLTFDLKDAVITIAGLLLGPVASLAISLLVAVLEFIIVSDTGVYGLIMNFVSSATFSTVAALVYTRRKRLSGAILSLSSAVLALVAVMMVMNLLVTPYFMGVAVSTVAAMLPTLLLPFNAVKALMNAALVLILYKPVSRAMQAAHVLPRAAAVVTPPSAPSNAEPSVDVPATKAKRLPVSLFVTLIGLLLLSLAVWVFYAVLGGQTELF